MIHARQPVTLAEVKEIVDKLEEKDVLKEYLKKFTQLSHAKAVKLKEELLSLNNLRLKEEYVVKIVDFLPRTAEDLRKLMHDTSVSEEEANAILEIVKKY